MGRLLAPAESVSFSAQRVSADSAANSSAMPRMPFTKHGSMSTAIARDGKVNSADSGLPVSLLLSGSRGSPTPASWKA